jgi:hypothetical protein
MKKEDDWLSLEQILSFMKEIDVEKIVSVDLSNPSKKYIYLDFDPKTEKYRIVYTKSIATDVKNKNRNERLENLGFENDTIPNQVGGNKKIER